jgi:hypothetical protein
MKCARPREGSNRVLLESCPGCGALLPQSAGATHRYVGASAACWAIFAGLSNGDDPPLAPGRLNPLLRDAYMVQHPGAPSPQAIQSVAVHLLTLYGVLERGVAPENALWIRQRAVRGDAPARHSRFVWLTPPAFEGVPTVAEIAAEPTPAVRTALVDRYARAVWDAWARRYRETIAGWYERVVLADWV